MRRCLCFAGQEPGRANPMRHGERACGQRAASLLDAQPSGAQTCTTFNCRQADHPLRGEGAAGHLCMSERPLLGWRADHAEKPS
jgi:hypothetical protein